MEQRTPRIRGPRSSSLPWSLPALLLPADVLLCGNICAAGTTPEAGRRCAGPTPASSVFELADDVGLHFGDGRLTVNEVVVEDLAKPARRRFAP
jgi:hypothetical protein